MVDGVTDIADKRIDVLIRSLRSADKAHDENEQLQFKCAIQIRDLLESGWSTRKLAAELKERGYVSPKTGRPMSYETIRLYGLAAVNHGCHSWTDAFALAKAGATEEEAEEIMDEAAETGEAASTVAKRKKALKAQEGKLPVPNPGTGKESVLSAVAGSDKGVTDSEIESVTELKHQTASARRKDLLDEGWLVGDEVNKRGGQTVWYLSEEGALQFGQTTGRKPVRRKRTKRAAPRPRNESPDERRRRLEREAIRAAEEEFLDRNSGAARFRSSLKDWGRWIGAASHLGELTEKYTCPPATQEALLQLLDRFVEIATETGEALRKQQPAPVDLSYYKVLGVPVEATAAAIKKAYWDLARKYHPDANGGNDEKFKKVATAYTWLSDPEKRRLYNTYGPTAK